MNGNGTPDVPLVTHESPRLVIELSPDGRQVLVTGPLNNKLLCYSLLEGARDAIKDYVPSSIVRP
jgi:hypothetical protein